MIKNFGPGVPTYLDPTGRAWESLPFQAGKPLLNQELNLAADIAGSALQEWVQWQSPSGWLDSTVLSDSRWWANLFTPSATANELRLPSVLWATVNGWTLPVTNTNLSGGNSLDLGAGPSIVGSQRTDLVVLEVWRRLISPAPSTLGKSSGSRIWRNGNVKVPAAEDAALNLTDDLWDSNVNRETTKRVQVQYRLRVVQGVDLISHVHGIDDGVVANSVPATANAPDGVPCAGLTYSYQGNGLWRAGDGNPANSLGTVDGYMYAVPLLGVLRRNTAPFAKESNQNGGAASPGPSDRPDGLLCDILNARDIVDLRHIVSPTGWDAQEVLEKSTRLVLDNTLATRVLGSLPLGGDVLGDHLGVSGHTLLFANEIGPADTEGATRIADFDAVRRKFTDEALYEVATLELHPSGASWSTGEQITLNLTSFWQAYTPAGVRVMDITRAVFIGGSGKMTITSPLAKIENLGANPVGNVVVTLGTLPPGVTDEPLYLDVLIAYPPGMGLTRTPTASFGEASFVIDNPSQVPSDFDSLTNTGFDFPHRAVQVQYITTSKTITIQATSDVSPATSFILPERAQAVTSVMKNDVTSMSCTLDDSGRVVTLTSGQTVPTDYLTVTYTALRPLPGGGVNLIIWFEGRAPQAIDRALLPNTLTVLPRAVAPYVYVLTAGSATSGEGYPFPTAYVQTGAVFTGTGVSPAFEGDHDLGGTQDVLISNFSASVGTLRIPTFVGFEPTDPVAFERDPSDPHDAEGRSYYKRVQVGSYLPSAYAQGLSDPRRHKVVLPMLGELTADTPFGHKGQLVLVLISRWALFDQHNNVAFDSDAALNTTCASVYRIRGNLLNRSF